MSSQKSVSIDSDENENMENDFAGFTLTDLHSSSKEIVIIPHKLNLLAQKESLKVTLHDTIVPKKKWKIENDLQIVYEEENN